jgi:hypothetical protein
MYVPPSHMIEQQIHAACPANGGADQVAIPTELFRCLPRCALEGCEFDEAQHQRCNRMSPTG